jgi:predicted GNAT family N-acyltransferase
MTLRIECAYWSDEADQKRLRAIRTTVFIQEQNVPESMEWDELDRISIHFLAWMEDKPIACVRLIPDGHIGRMAVLPRWRNQGIGMQLLKACEQEARQRNVTRLLLSAQVQAIPFYEKADYVLISETYMDAGIPHRDMQKLLAENEKTL